VVVEGWVLVEEVVGEGEEEGCGVVALEDVDTAFPPDEDVGEDVGAELEVVVTNVLPTEFVVVRIPTPPAPPTPELLGEREADDTMLPLPLLVLPPATMIGTPTTTMDPALVVVCVTVVVLILCDMVVVVTGAILLLLTGIFTLLAGV
jgi:hypothetical protein